LLEGKLGRKVGMGFYRSILEGKRIATSAEMKARGKLGNVRVAARKSFNFNTMLSQIRLSQHTSTAFFKDCPAFDKKLGEPKNEFNRI
jgi:hypothetical protein